jgi:hypothetical protein
MSTSAINAATARTKNVKTNPFPKTDTPRPPRLGGELRKNRPFNLPLNGICYLADTQKF